VQPHLAKSTKRSRSETRSVAITAKARSERDEAKKKVTTPTVFKHTRRRRLMGEKEREAGSKFELDDEIRVALVGGMCAAWHCRVID
jgi:hypothetical protein